jgi:hypothetical protein
MVAFMAFIPKTGFAGRNRTGLGSYEIWSMHTRGKRREHVINQQMSRRGWLFAVAMAVFGAVLIACQPQTVIVSEEKIVKETVVVEVEKEVTKEVEVTKIVKEEVPRPVTVPADKPVEITMWTSVSEEAADVLREQLEQFREEAPHITVLYENLPNDAFLQKYEVAAAEGAPPDVVGLYSYTIQRLSGFLMPLDEFIAAEAVNDDDFVRAGLDSSSVDGQIYGLPWFRGQPCSPFYYSLGLSRNGTHHMEAFSLINFLTRPDIQVDRYQMSEQSLLPTRFSAYDQLGFNCPPTGQVVVLPPDQRERAAAIAEERAPNLQEILDRNTQELDECGIRDDRQTFGTQRSTAAITYGDQQEPLEYNPDEPPEASMLAVVTPVDLNYTREEFDAALSGPGVIVGAIFGVDERLLLQLEGGDEFVIEPGANFAVKWQGTGGREVEWRLVDENGDEYQLGVAELEDLMVDPDAKPEEVPVGRPYVTIELGTCYIHFHMDRYTTTIYIKNKYLYRYLDFIERYGGTIYSWDCW